MITDQFYICDEDNVFDTLNELYEDLPICPYAGAPGLDPDLEWGEEDYYLNLLGDSLGAELEEDYGSDQFDLQRGDIVVAEVYQDGPNHNLRHKVRPFLITYATANYMYGFQISHSTPPSLEDYRVEIPNYAACGLREPCSFMVNMVRGVDIRRIKFKVGHITPEAAQALLQKLYEIEADVDGIYEDCLLKDRIASTITNVERIRC